MSPAKLASEMGEATFALWMAIGERLVKGEKDYGGFKFEEKDLDLEAMEELMDWVVYRTAKKFLENQEKGKSSG